VPSIADIQYSHMKYNTLQYNGKKLVKVAGKKVADPKRQKDKNVADTFLLESLMFIFPNTRQYIMIHSWKVLYLNECNLIRDFSLM